MSDQNGFPVEESGPRSGSIATIIWLHGIGQRPGVMVDVARRLDPSGRLRGVFPAAPARRIGRVTKDPVTAWYEQSVFRYREMDLPSAFAAEARLRSLVADEVERAGRTKVLLAGFSQGAAVSLMLGLRSTQRIAGLMLYAPYLPDQLEPLLATTRTLPTSVPIWLGHGVEDWVVPTRAGQHVRDTLTKWGYPVVWQDSRSGHEPFAGVRSGVWRFLRDTVGLSEMSHPSEQGEPS